MAKLEQDLRQQPLSLISQGLAQIVNGRIKNGTAFAEPGKPVNLAMRVEGLSAWYGNPRQPVIEEITLPIAINKITSLIGPSGCGKSTLLRCLNRMHEVTAGAGLEGAVFLDSQNIYHPRENVVDIRRRVGMVFQKPNPFEKSIVDDVTSGWRLWFKGNKYETAEKYLSLAGLWDEVKDRLKKPSTSLSVGQQQRLCIARALAVEPEVLLMDEPCSALDPVNTSKIASLMYYLKGSYTIVIATHHMQQAARVSDYVAFLCKSGAEGSAGRLIEYGTAQMFVKPGNQLTESYITGRFG